MHCNFPQHKAPQHLQNTMDCNGLTIRKNKMKKLNIIKIGGNVIDNDSLLDLFLKDLAAIGGPKILIHGGGNLTTKFARKLNVPQKMVFGRRVTDKATLDLAVMIYSGLISKKIVSKLQSMGCDAMGFCGADGNFIKSTKRIIAETDFGFVGDIDDEGVNSEKIDQFLKLGIVLVFSAITHDGNGNLLNTNADTIASKIAIAMSKKYDTNLTYCFEKKGVLIDVKDENSLLETIHFAEYEKLKMAKIISDGMIPKMENAFASIENGVSRVKICHAENIHAKGTELIAL